MFLRKVGFLYIFILLTASSLWGQVVIRDSVEIQSNEVRIIKRDFLFRAENSKLPDVNYIFNKTSSPILLKTYSDSLISYSDFNYEVVINEEKICGIWGGGQISIPCIYTYSFTIPVISFYIPENMKYELVGEAFQRTGPPTLGDFVSWENSNEEGIQYITENNRIDIFLFDWYDLYPPDTICFCFDYNNAYGGGMLHETEFNENQPIVQKVVVATNTVAFQVKWIPTYHVENNSLFIVIYGLHHLDVHCEPDSMSSQTSIYVQGKDFNDMDFDKDTDEILIFTLDPLAEHYGRLVSYNQAGVTYDYAHAGNVKYVIEKAIPDSIENLMVKVICKDDTTVYGTANLLKLIPDHFEVTMIPDTINHSEISTIMVQAKDKFDGDLDLPQGTCVNFFLFSGGGVYGSFLSPDSVISDALANIIYEDAKAGKVKFIADGEEPDEPQEVEITVTSRVDDEDKEGMGIVVIKSSTYSLNITIPEPAQIWPTMPSGKSKNPNKRNVQENIKVALLKDDLPVINQDITITLQMILPSGGHDHTNQPPANLMGQLVGDNIGTTEVTIKTDTTGTGIVKYTAPEFGGLFEFTAMTVLSEDTLLALDTLKVRVPDLELLPESEYYTKVGGTAKHHGPPDYQEDHNHYGITKILTSIQNIAADYDSLHSGVKLLINDISLPYGGLFDINGDWQPPHKEHRMGKSADIDDTGIDQNGQAVEVNLRHLVLAIINNTDDDYYTHKTHYHIRVR